MAPSGLFARNFDPVLSFSFQEVITSKGIITLYPVVGGSSTTRFLTNNIIESSPISSSAPSSGATGEVRVMDHDYEVVVDKTFVLDGKAVVSIPIYGTQAGFSFSFYSVVTIQKWDGTTETDLSDAAKSNTEVSAFSTKEYVLVTALPTITNKIIKAGETLRIRIEIWYWASSGGSSHSMTIKYAHNPANGIRDWDTSGKIPSQTKILLPTKININ